VYLPQCLSECCGEVQSCMSLDAAAHVAPRYGSASRREERKAIE